MRAQSADFKCRNREFKIIPRRSGARKMQYRMDRARDMDVIRHIMPDKLEPVLAKKMLNIPTVARNQVVYGDDRMTLGDKIVAEMTTDKPGAAGNQDTH